VAIAGARERGILQTDLVRKVVQDNRSVPRRTDYLHARGYIEKRLAMASTSTATGKKRGVRTSFLIHRRYAAQLAKPEATKPAKPEMLGPSTDVLQMLDLEEFTKQILDLLRGGDLVAKSDIKYILVSRLYGSSRRCVLG
jgi:transcription factor C subunit 3